MTRLHSAIRYRIEYSTDGKFCFDADIINPIIYILVEGDCEFNGSDIYYSDRISARRATLIKNLDKIINPDESWEYQERLNSYIEILEKSKSFVSNFQLVPLTRQYLYDNLKALIEQSDNESEDIHFAWF